MKKIVIIGNGFDIAHGLPTKYEDFMNYLLNSIVTKKMKTSSSWTYEYLGIVHGSFIHLKTPEETKDPWIGSSLGDSGMTHQLKANPFSKPRSIYFHSLFKSYEHLGHWSDLESHYFDLIQAYQGSIDAIKIINAEFDHLKNLLSHYLTVEVEAKVGSELEFTPSKSNPIFQMLESEHNGYSFYEEYFVSFNYTSKILQQYLFWLQESNPKRFELSKPIHIHGDLINKDNPIIFGYGDDNSIEYKALQNSKEKELLKNFKTFQYLRSNRYRAVLGLLESDTEIYVQIIGHSCDIGDKTLLRTIFQHPNVRHIEVPYYKNETKYFEKLYNISRIFDDNTLMRNKIIPLEDTFKY